ncbi:unnamed protein product [Hymenolepis diminuta]|uniref:Integrase zinc-binding domain-containing protein n=1 Tax=Hymenolepis diminuta TaxID=6216 RepID=A0A564YWR4_HYMDI|nr:unnamed protein product [Hymenolepis diminuta]
MKFIIRTHAYWSGMDGDIDAIIKRCPKCQQAVEHPSQKHLAPALKLHLRGPVYTWILLDLSTDLQILSW